MNKKVGILTFHNALNYGAVLQAFALQTKLEELGCDAFILNYSNQYVKTRLNKPSLRDYRNPLNYFNDVKIFNKNKLKSENIKNFISENLNITEPLDKNKLSTYIDDFDIVFVGSDQVWNDDITHNDDSFYLDFVPTCKKYSYAASLGKSSIPLENLNRVYDLLSSFSGISVREKQAQISLKEQLGIESEQVVDPTLLLNLDSYQKFITDDKKEDYILLYMLLYSKTLIDKAKQLSKHYNCPVYCINSSGKLVNDFVDCSDIGVEEWLSLFANAKYVLTNSFHGTAFSVNFNKQFSVELPPAKIKANSRITDFLTMVGLEERILLDLDNICDLPFIDFIDANNRLNSERIKSIEFIKKSLNNRIVQNKKDIKKSIISIKSNRCCGCGACVQECKFEAIAMTDDEKGFSRPAIDPTKCVNCGMCKKSCVFNNEYNRLKKTFEVKAYAAFNKEIDVLKKSSSGGMFYALSEYVLKQNGVVYGASFNDDFVLKHTRITSIDDIKPLMGSKYAQSNSYLVFNQIEDDLKNNLIVLFVGTPCQVATVRQKFQKYPNLILVDFVCHGVPSPKMVQEHIRYIEKKTGKRIIEYNPRSKVNGWGHHELFTFSDGTFEFKDPISQAYKNIFHKDLSIRSSCFNCPFTSFDRPGDLTIADFWGLEKCHPELYFKDGVSLVLVSTSLGKKILNSLNSVAINEVKISDIPIEKQPHLFKPLSLNISNYDEFWSLYKRYGWEYVCCKYAGCDSKSLIKWKVKQTYLYQLVRGKK